MGNGNSFVKITNQQVFDRLVSLEKTNDRAHNKILSQISGYSDQVSRLKWMTGGMATLLLINLGWFVTHLLSEEKMETDQLYVNEVVWYKSKTVSTAVADVVTSIGAIYLGEADLALQSQAVYLPLLLLFIRLGIDKKIVWR